MPNSNTSLPYLLLIRYQHAGFGTAEMIMISSYCVKAKEKTRGQNLTDYPFVEIKIESRIEY